MSKLTILDKAAVIRNETQPLANTRGRVADVLEDIANTLVDEAALNNEATARAQGDQDNAEAINAEATARAQGDALKLDKPTSDGSYYIAKTTVAGIPYYKYRVINLSSGQIPVSMGTYIGASLLYESVSGRIGLDTPNPSEKFEVYNGRVKSDGFILTSSAVSPLPKEIKFKGGNFVGAKDDGIERKFLMEGDSADNLLGEYVYNGNQEIYWSAFDYATSIGTTTVPHGLTVGTTYHGGIVADAFKNLDNFSDLSTFNANSRTIPWEYFNSFVVTFKVLSANTIQILEWNGGGNPTAVNVSSTNNLNNLNTIAWHLEKPPAFYTFFDIISNIPTGIKNIRIEILGCYWQNFSPYSGARIFMTYHNGMGGYISGNAFDSIDLSWGSNRTNLLGYSVININASRLIGLVSGFYWSQYRASGNNTFTGASGNGVKAFSQNSNHNGFSSLRVIGNYFFNGTKFKIYKS